MVMCFAPDCKHYSERDGCKFFRFPKDEKEKKGWIKLIRRQDTDPKESSRICSCHFKDGLRENGPVFFEHNRNKRLEFDSPKTKTKAYKIRASVATSSEPTLCSSQDLEEIPVNTVTNVVLAEAEMYFLKKQVGELEGRKKQPFLFEDIQEDNEKVMLYTGLPNKDIFMALFDLLNKVERTYYLEWNVLKLEPQDQLFLCLYKLRLNTPYAEVADRFKVCTATVSNIFITWLHLLHEIIFKTLMSNVPSRFDNEASLPSCFALFPNTRMVIDCTEIFSERPTSMSKPKELYSSYKHRNTLKGLVGVAPNGIVTYISDLYTGSTSDKAIVGHCGVLEIFEAGDLIIADKGFLINDLLPAGVSLNIPPFLLQPQFTEEQVTQTRNIARARIHVERAIGRIKNYRILSLVPQNLLPMSNKIWQVYAALTNFQFPLIKEVYSN